MTLREASDVRALLSDQDIRPKRLTPGVWTRATCPKCEGGRDREESLAVRVDNDTLGAIWKCHRGTCGWEGNGRVAGAGRADGAGSRVGRPERVVQPPPAHPPAVVSNRPSALYRFFQERGIGQETVDLFGCYIARRWFPEHADLPAGEHPAIVFPYVWQGQTRNRKYRSPRKLFMQEKDALPTLYNVDAVDETDPQMVWWVEGEADCLAMHEAGYPQTVTLPNGAPKKLRDEDDPAREHDERFAPLRTHADLLSKVKRFVLAGDMDGPGQVLREELARRLGRHRCWIVTWPSDCKDAGDVLKKHGAERVRAYMARSGSEHAANALRTSATWAWPLPNVWLGVSAEDQRRADERIPHLLDTPAAVRWVSAEPLLGAIDVAWAAGSPLDGSLGIDWLVAGGESGPGARPSHPGWFRSLRDQCAAAGVAFHFKQNGEWLPFNNNDDSNWYARHPVSLPLRWWDGAGWREATGEPPAAADWVARIGKKGAGRLLDGREHNGMPAALETTR